VILMDIDDTLFDFPTGNRRAVTALMRELDLWSDTVFDEYQCINHACWEALERGEMTQEVLHVERFRRFLKSKNRSDDPVQVADRFSELLGAQAIPLPHSEEMVRAIAQERRVVLLTNGITVIQKRRIALSPIREWIADMVISQEAGVSKPDPRIFEIALNGVPTDRALMIGDGLTSDVLGANRAGVDMCWYNPKGKPLPEGLRAEYEVTDLLDCVPIALQ
ncbi:MAG: YjjG family noncanonical pyrimidine nucleotidase, partial [Oscillospiraceae bacterium]|nr:YjjG family noncanonical pyrimidine nucleotidase [Oscillospiraceae bacterium]